MAEYVNVAVDAMGGDNAPAEMVKVLGKLSTQISASKYSW